MNMLRENDWLLHAIISIGNQWNAIKYREVYHNTLYIWSPYMNIKYLMSYNDWSYRFDEFETNYALFLEWGQHSTKPSLSNPPSVKVRNHRNPLPPTLADVICERSHIGWPIYFHDTDNTNSYFARSTDQFRPYLFIQSRGIAMFYLVIERMSVDILYLNSIRVLIFGLYPTRGNCLSTVGGLAKSWGPDAWCFRPVKILGARFTMFP